MTDDTPRLAQRQSQPVAYRWRPLGKFSSTWIYDPTPEWIEDHKNEIELEALYSHPVTSTDSTSPELTPTRLVNDLLSACDPSNWDADRNTGDYFKGLRDAYEHIYELTGLIPAGEPVMLFRAQDKHFVAVLRFYREQVARDNGDPRLLLAVAEQIERGRKWPTKKSPDMPSVSLQERTST